MPTTVESDEKKSQTPTSNPGSSRANAQRRLDLNGQAASSHAKKNPPIAHSVNHSTKTSRQAIWCIGRNFNGEFGIGNKNAQKQLMKCDWSDKIEIRKIYVANHYTVIEDMGGNYYSAGYNSGGACTMNDESSWILNMTPITYFKENNIKISQVFVSNGGSAPFWKAEDGSIYTSCNNNDRGCVGVDVDKN
eukprot:479688_1